MAPISHLPVPSLPPARALPLVLYTALLDHVLFATDRAYSLQSMCSIHVLTCDTCAYVNITTEVCCNKIQIAVDHELAFLGPQDFQLCGPDGSFFHS